MRWSVRILMEACIKKSVTIPVKTAILYLSQLDSKPMIN